MDRRGPSVNPNIYFMVPVAATGTGSLQLWALNVITNSLIRLADPTLAVTAVAGVGTAAVFDESLQRIWLFNATSVGPNWARWQYYDIATDTWTARDTASMGLAAQWSTDAALLHFDENIATGSTAISSDIYLIGNNSVDIQNYNIGTNTWTQLTGAGGGVRAAAPAVGATLTWNLQYPDRIISHRGGGVATLDIYDIPSDGWNSGQAYLPVGTLLWDEGSDACECVPPGAGLGNPIGYAGIAGTIYQYTRDYTYTQACKIEGTDGLAHVGKGLIAYQYAGVRYVVYRLHSSRSVQRIRLID
jgi:hypothetical protein